MRPYTVFLICFLMSNLSVVSTKAGEPDEKDYLHKRVFTISMSEVKFGQVSKKPIADEFRFKNGRLYSTFIYKKYGHRYLDYRVKKDTVYFDETNTKVRTLEVEAVVTDETNRTVLLNFVTTEWDIDGTIKITKHDKLKRKLDFVGREKGGKPKKIKKRKTRPALIEIKRQATFLFKTKRLEKSQHLQRIC